MQDNIVTDESILKETVPDPYITLNEAASLFRVHPDTFKRWCREGRFKRYGTVRVQRVRMSEVFAALQLPPSPLAVDQLERSATRQKKAGIGPAPPEKPQASPEPRITSTYGLGDRLR